MFAGRTADRDLKYFLERSPSLTFANMLRNNYIITRYKHPLGNLKENIIGWIKIVQATKPEVLPTALKYGMDLGIPWNEIRAFSAQYSQIVDRRITLIRHDGETRSIQ